MKNRSVTGPHFIGLGGEASGSGFLYTYIAEHPAVILTDRDTRFFCDDTHFSRGTVWYEGQLTAGRSHQIRGEAAFGYLACPQSAERIVRTYPDAKLLAVVCDPIDRVCREYRRAKETGRIARQMSMARYLEVEPQALERGLFGAQLERYFDYYSSLQLYICVHEDRFVQPIEYVQSVYTFLEVDQTYVPKALRQFVPPNNDEKKHPWYWPFVRLVTLPLRLLRLDRLAYWVWPTLRRQIRRFYTRPTMPHSRSSLAIPPPLKQSLDPELRSILEEYYGHDVRVLSRLLHRDLNTEWGIAPPAHPKSVN